MTKWSVPALTAAFILGAVVGGSFTQPQPLRAAGSMPVYGIYEANVTDQENYKDRFLSLVVPKLEKNGIKYLARGGKNSDPDRTGSAKPCRGHGGCEHGRRDGLLE